VKLNNGGTNPHREESGSREDEDMEGKVI